MLPSNCCVLVAPARSTLALKRLPSLRCAGDAVVHEHRVPSEQARWRTWHRGVALACPRGVEPGVQHGRDQLDLGRARGRAGDLAAWHAEQIVPATARRDDRDHLSFAARRRGRADVRGQLGRQYDPTRERGFWAGKTLPLPCVSTAFVAKTLPLPCVSTRSPARCGASRSRPRRAAVGTGRRRTRRTRRNGPPRPLRSTRAAGW